MNNKKRVLAIAIIAAMSASAFASCGGNTSSESSSSEPSSTVESSEESSTEPETESGSTPFVYATDTLNQKFNYLYSSLAYDREVAGMCTDTLLINDRSGEIIMNGIEGEVKPYNGTDYTYTGLADCTVTQNADDTTTYSFKLREGVLFSDGEEMNADDVIFTMYVMCDPTYTGTLMLSTEDIVGLQNYQTQTSVEVYDRYNAMFDYFYANDDAGEYGDEMRANYETALKSAWVEDLQATVDYVYANYGASVDTYMEGIDAATLDASADLKVAYGMVLWGFASYADGVVTTNDSGETFDVAGGTYPTIEDFYEEAVAKYSTAAAYDKADESAIKEKVVDNARADYISVYGAQDESMSEEGVPNIAGIVKTGDYSFDVTTNGYATGTIYTLSSVPIMPMHYYGDESKYDYENNQFGFDFGDTSAVETNVVPMGTGAYIYDNYENRTVYFSANENYWKGAPKTKEIQFKETQEADKIAAIGTGTADVTNPSGSKEKMNEIASYNSNGETTGDVVTVFAYDNLGYGYIGLNALNMKVGTTEDDMDSEESIALRKGFATVLAVYRDIANDSYYGDAAKVIQYSISDCSWAAPQSTDEGYEIAYSTDVDGNPIYTSDMTDDEKFDAALQASIGFFKKAGYTWDEASGKFTAAPEGAKMSYEVIIPGGGAGEHPAYMLLEYARDALESIGITLVINDPSDSNVLWNALDANTEEMWTAAWSSGIDPDMYDTWHSKNVVGAPGSNAYNHAYLIDDELDSLIESAHVSSDQTYRKAVYKQCLDIIKDWAVEVPNYQRQNVFLFSTERVNMDTVTPDITTYWSWRNDLELLEMNG